MTRSSLACTTAVLLILGSSSAAQDRDIKWEYSQKDIGDGLREFSVHFSDSRPNGYSRVRGGRVSIFTSEPYIACGESQRNVVQTGAGKFYTLAINNQGEMFEVTLDQDNISHGSSTISGDISILGAIEQSKCPNTVAPLTYILKYAPSTIIQRKQEAGNLPLEKTYSKHISYRVSPNGQIEDKGDRVRVDNDLYKFCSESLNLELSGDVKMSRIPSDTTFSYSFQLWPDIVWHQTSAVEGDIVLVATLDREKSKCKPFAEAFPALNMPSPAEGWTKISGYVSKPSGHAATSQTLELYAPLPNYRYCSHRIHVNTKVGNSYFYPKNWTSKGLTIAEVADNYAVNYPYEASSIGITVYVKFVPDASNDSECGPFPTTTQFNYNTHGQPEDFWYFTPGCTPGTACGSNITPSPPFRM